MRVLVLGGSTEATNLATALAGDRRFVATLSLAGVTRAPRPPPIACRIGGFGGMAGLAGYLRQEGIERLVDASHPFAAQMKRHAAQAAHIAGVAMIHVIRPAWTPCEGDRWTPVADTSQAVEAIGDTSRRVLLTIGQKDLAPFKAAPCHKYVIRSIDPPAPESCPAHAVLITGRAPFDQAAERALFLHHHIEVLVTKNSGGQATAAKLAAARQIGLPVIMIGRPAAPTGRTEIDAQAALRWLANPHEANRGV